MPITRLSASKRLYIARDGALYCGDWPLPDPRDNDYAAHKQIGWHVAQCFLDGATEVQVVALTGDEVVERKRREKRPDETADV